MSVKMPAPDQSVLDRRAGIVTAFRPRALARLPRFWA